jgi:hypothetical protein
VRLRRGEAVSVMGRLRPFCFFAGMGKPRGAVALQHEAAFSGVHSLTKNHQSFVETRQCEALVAADGTSIEA